MGKNLFRDVGVLEYNGYRFNNTTRTTGVRVRPVLDAAGRGVTHNEWALSFRTHLANLAKTDAEFITLCERLSAPGMPLRFEGRGVGNPRVNIAGAQDVKWGPTPGPVEAEVTGEGTALDVSWSVQFHMPPCPNGRHQFDLMELVFSVTHDVDPAGFVDRTVRGHLAVPLTRPGPSLKLLDSADEYRRSIVPARVRGFRRVFGPWVLSDDRRRLDWEYRDVEIRGEQYPPGVVDATVSDDLSASQAGLRHWTGQINAEYTLRKGLTGLEAARLFLRVVRLRLAGIRDRVKKLPAKDEQGAEPIPIAFRMSNPDRHGPPRAAFSLSYTLAGVSLKSMIQAGGLWAPVPESSWTWDAWVESHRLFGLAPYGYVNLRFQPGDDRIVSLCGPQQNVLFTEPAPLPPPVPPPPQLTTSQMANMHAYLTAELQATFPTPSPAKSWLKYTNEIWVETDNGVVPVRALPEKPLTKSTDLLGGTKDALGQAIDALKLVTMPADVASGFSVPTAGTLQTLRRVEPTVFVYLRGSAVRVGHPVEPPRLLTVGGVEAVPANRLDRGEGFGKRVSTGTTAPVHMARWNLRYWLPAMPAVIPTPPVPIEGAPSSGGLTL